MSNLSRAQLINLVEKLISCEGSEAQEHKWITLLERNVPHPAITDLIYWSDDDLSPAEIIDRALAYKPAVLGPSPMESSEDESDS